MKLYFSLMLLFFLYLIIYPSANAMTIEGAQIVDVVVADSGSTDSTFTTRIDDGWEPLGPESFDIDRDGNIYILDQLGARVMKFDKDGQWRWSFELSKQKGEQKPGEDYRSLAVDNWGNFYVIKGVAASKFSPTEGFLYSLSNTYWLALTDKSGRFYTFGDELLGGIIVYSAEGIKEGNIQRFEHDYKDNGLIQKEVGNDIYFRVSRYLVKTSLKDYIESKKIDTVGVLPDWVRLRKFADDKVREEGWIEHPYIFIGFDQDSCFYFHQEEDYSRFSPWCLIHTIVRLRLEKGKLVKPKEAVIRYNRGQEECCDRELLYFYRQFIVSGDGTIYFLHGTVDKIKVSKITME